MLLLFFTLILSPAHSGVLQKLHDVWYLKRLNAKADMKIQLSSIKPDNRVAKIKIIPIFSPIFLF